MKIEETTAWIKKHTYVNRYEAYEFTEGIRDICNCCFGHDDVDISEELCVQFYGLWRAGYEKGYSDAY